MTAVLIKEWRRMVRASSTPWLLLGYLLVPVAVAAAYLQTPSQGPNGLMAQQVPMLGGQALSNVAAWQLLLLAIAAPWLSGSMLASEVEGRTLDSLLAAGGRIWSLVLAKWLAVVSFLWLVVVAGLPAFALPFLVGGVSWPLLVRVLVLEVAAVAGLAGVGMALSAFGRRSGSTALAGLALGIALTLGTGLASGMAPNGVYSEEMRAKLLLMSRMPVPGDFAGIGGMTKWLYANPLVGLNTALNNVGTQSMFGLPGANAAPVYKHYRLWQVQAIGSAALALVGQVMAWLTMAIRLRWRRPLWTFRLFRRRKEVATHG